MTQRQVSIVLRYSFRNVLLSCCLILSLFVLVSSSSSSTSTSSYSIISTAESRLPMSITTVITDLEAEGCNEITPICFLTSRSVTQLKKQTLFDDIFQGSSSSSSSTMIHSETCKVIGLSNGIVMVQPNGLSEIVSCTAVCDGTIVYYPDPMDLIREEGLFDTLAPALERILHNLNNENNNNDDTLSYTKPTLYVIGTDETLQSRFEQIALEYLSNLIVPNSGGGKNTKTLTLQDVFEQVVYVAVDDIVDVLTEENYMITKSPSSISSKVSYMASSTLILKPPTLPSSDLTPINLAAARLLGPAARIQLNQVIQDVKRSCLVEDTSDDTISDNNNNEEIYKYVSSFGELCNAAISLALKRFNEDENNTFIRKSSSSKMGKHIQSDLLSNLDIQLSKIYEKQLDLLTQTSFDEFKKRISKLLISPNLEIDMYQQMKISLSSFQSNLDMLIPNKILYLKKRWYNLGQSYYNIYQRQLKDYIINRILNAKASGQFKPLPRKGITVGLHYLLPKPFGNDYRQEPWMVHATDNMIYIPQNKKLTDVSTDEILSSNSDWRNKIIPNPAGNDMLYMQ